MVVQEFMDTLLDESSYMYEIWTRDEKGNPKKMLEGEYTDVLESDFVYNEIELLDFEVRRGESIITVSLGIDL